MPGIFVGAAGAVTLEPPNLFHMTVPDPRFKAIAAHVALFVDDVQVETTDAGLSRWRCGDRIAWFENENGKLRIKSRTGNGIITEIRDDPGEKRVDDDILAHDPADIAALIADALVDTVEPCVDGPQGLS